MPWIESHTVLLRHRKLRELSRDLRLKSVHLMGHLQAVQKGGSHTAENVVPACKRCNSRKWTKTPLEFMTGFNFRAGRHRRTRNA